MSDDDRQFIEATARKHGVEADAVTAASEALRRGAGSMAQFSHPAFGGMAQWSQGGMSMVGDMFNRDMKAKLDGVMSDLAEAMQAETMQKGASAGGHPPSAPPDANGGGRDRGGDPHQDGSSNWWGQDFGRPSSSGSQNDMRYAFFPDSHRLVVDDGEALTVYDTASHMISGVSQQQSSDRTLGFRSQNGPVALNELRVVDGIGGDRTGPGAAP